MFSFRNAEGDMLICRNAKGVHCQRKFGNPCSISWSAMSPRNSQLQRQ